MSNWLTTLLLCHNEYFDRVNNLSVIWLARMTGKLTQTWIYFASQLRGSFSCCLKRCPLWAKMSLLCPPHGIAQDWQVAIYFRILWKMFWLQNFKIGLQNCKIFKEIYALVSINIFKMMTIVRFIQSFLGFKTSKKELLIKASSLKQRLKIKKKNCIP